MTGIIAAVIGFSVALTIAQTPVQTVPGDPLKAQIYKLNNGLTVYLTVYKNAPRIQTYIAVKAGSKNDPSDATGLAHYLEHMLFKGTDRFGSLDYAKESIELQKIEDLFETYRSIKDPSARKTMYHKIDSISGVASHYAIANEYDKLMAGIGSLGTNAYTSFEQTVYVENIPSNQLDKWAAIQAERFRKPVLRLFHTELEAVYEEKNRGLDDDNNKVWEALFAGLFAKHPYGTQTTIGTIDHLKNPSIKKIKDYYNTYYVPNNMALCISGDFKPDSVIQLIKKHFEALPSKAVPTFHPPVEAPILRPIVKEVLGPNSEEVALGFRFAGANTSDGPMLNLIGRILSNGKAGLFDLNLNQQQKVLESSAYPYLLKDYSFLILDAKPKDGQNLDQVKGLLLAQLEKLKNGEFPDWLISAIVNNARLEETKTYEDNNGRANAFVTSFTTDIPWKDYIHQVDKMGKITKQEVMAFAKAHLNQNYVVVYKRTGEDKSVQKVEKPQITPVDVNREAKSDFVKNTLATAAPAIEPVFVDYNKDVTRLLTDSKVNVLYRANTENATFLLDYVIPQGTNDNKKLRLAMDYLNYLGTKEYSPEQFQQEFYKIGCSFEVQCAEDHTDITLTGLSANFDRAVTLFESLLKDAQPQPEALQNLIGDVLKSRQDAMLDKKTILFSGLLNYGLYGKENPFTNLLTTEELKHLAPNDLISLIHDLNNFDHHFLYYGDLSSEKLIQTLNARHWAPANRMAYPPTKKFETIETQPVVFAIDYDMKQAELLLLSKSVQFNPGLVPMATLFNEYFGGGMASVVFQDMRESKALAYSVFSRYTLERHKERNNFMLSYIGTQSDKLPEALGGMTALLKDMPESESVFNMAKNSILQTIRTERITKASILFSYENSLRLGIDYDQRKVLFNQLPTMQFKDIQQFHKDFILGKPATLLLMGKKDGVNQDVLNKYGKVTWLHLKDIFGYDKTN